MSRKKTTSRKWSEIYVKKGSLVRSLQNKFDNESEVNKAEQARQSVQAYAKSREEKWFVVKHAVKSFIQGAECV